MVNPPVMSCRFSLVLITIYGQALRSQYLAFQQTSFVSFVYGPRRPQNQKGVHHIFLCQQTAAQICATSVWRGLRHEYDHHDSNYKLTSQLIVCA